MLLNIPSVISPELLAVLNQMGHGDVLVIGDGNFPGASIAKAQGAKLIRADGHGVPLLLDAILKLMPLDQYVAQPVALMEVTAQDAGLDVPIWNEYRRIIAEHDDRGDGGIKFLERFAFYEESKKAYCVVQSGEGAIYANVMLQKGVVK